MSEQIETCFRETLNDVDRIRKRQGVAFVVFFCIVIACLLWLGHLAEIPGNDVRQMLLWSVVTLFFAGVYIALAVALYVNKMLRKVLRAMQPLCER
jgi:RsiW-degrading membrane proteinase PrsW (M82 family)